VNALRRADQVQLAAAWIRRHGDEATCLQRRSRLPRIAETVTHDDRGAREPGVGVAHAHRDGRDVVRVGAREEARRRRRERGRHRRTGGQRLVTDVDQLQRVAGDVRIVGDDERHRLADITHDAPRDGRLQVTIGARGRRHAIGDDRCGRHVVGGDEEAHTRQLARALAVDAQQSRVGVRRA
jgi:hypothetical protein